tara:strand:+ start:9567 stop:11762 length:2196 start_codon:yes stop_codon:yes gene_type:complete
MNKKSLYLLILALIPATFAQSIIEAALDGIFLELTPTAANYILAFSLTTTLAYLALQNLAFDEDGKNTVGTGIISAVLGFATAYFVYFNGFNFIGLVVPFLGILIIAMLGLMVWNIFKHFDNEGATGLNLVISGMLLLVLSQAVRGFGNHVESFTSRTGISDIDALSSIVFDISPFIFIAGIFLILYGLTKVWSYISAEYRDERRHPKRTRPSVPEERRTPHQRTPTPPEPHTPTPIIPPPIEPGPSPTHDIVFTPVLPNPNPPPPSTGIYNPRPPRKPKLPNKPSPRQPDEKEEPDVPPIPEGEKVFVDLSGSFNPVKNQGDLGACSAFATTSIFEYIMNRRNKAIGLDLSPLFLYFYGRINKNSDSGCHSHQVCSSMITLGSCKERLWNYMDTGRKYLTEPTEDARMEALLHRPISVAVVKRSDPNQWIQQLIKGNPLLIGIDTPKDFNHKTKEYYENQNPRPSGGHSMVLVGYNSHYVNPAGKTVKAFKLRNSWGSNWADNGYVWVEQGTFLKILDEPLRILKGWNKNLPKAPKQNFNISGRVVFDSEHINTKMSGSDIYKTDLKSPTKFKVGVMAQANGKIIHLAETQVKNNAGKFSIQLSEVPPDIQSPTLIVKEFKDRMGKINTEFIQPGLIVYCEYNEQSYFHMVNFNHSKSGRGGEGIEFPMNPISSEINKNLDFSGRTIKLSNSHSIENYVVIPIWSKHTSKTPTKPSESEKKYIENIKNEE